MIERTLVVLKPDAVKRGLVGRIISRLEDAGLKIVGMNMRQADDQLVLDHYDDLEGRIGKEAFAAVCRYVQSGPVVAIALEGDGAVAVVRKLVGATAPAEAAPGTIRGDLCHQGWRSPGDIRAIFNLIHASGTPGEAAEELALWFDEADLHAYAAADEEFAF